MVESNSRNVHKVILMIPVSSSSCFRCSSLSPLFPHFSLYSIGLRHSVCSSICQPLSVRFCAGLSLSVCLSFCLPVSLYNCLSLCLPISAVYLPLSVWLSFYLSIYVYAYLFLSAYLSVCLSLCLLILLSAYLSICSSPPVRSSLSVCVSLPILLSVCLYLVPCVLLHTACAEFMEIQKEWMLSCRFFALIDLCVWISKLSIALSLMGCMVRGSFASVFAPFDTRIFTQITWSALTSQGISVYRRWRNQIRLTQVEN